jgi:hypothetical protein
MRMSYLTTVALFVIGGGIGLFGESLNAIWSWLIMGFLTGLMAPSILKWVWWRFNAVGYATGMAAGIISAGVQGSHLYGAAGVCRLPLRHRLLHGRHPRRRLPGASDTPRRTRRVLPAHPPVRCMGTRCAASTHPHGSLRPTARTGATCCCLSRPVSRS